MLELSPPIHHLTAFDKEQAAARLPPTFDYKGHTRPQFQCSTGNQPTAPAHYSAVILAALFWRD